MKLAEEARNVSVESGQSCYTEKITGGRFDKTGFRYCYGLQFVAQWTSYLPRNFFRMGSGGQLLMLLVRWGYQLLNKSGSRVGKRLLFVPWPLLYTQIKYFVNFVIFLGLFAPQFLRKGSGGQLLMLLVRWGYRLLNKSGSRVGHRLLFVPWPLLYTQI